MACEEPSIGLKPHVHQYNHSHTVSLLLRDLEFPFYNRRYNQLSCKGTDEWRHGKMAREGHKLGSKKCIFSDRPVATSLRLRYCPVLGSLLRLLPTLSSPCPRNPHMSRNMLLLDERSGAVGESARCGEIRERDTCYL